MSGLDLSLYVRPGAGVSEAAVRDVVTELLPAGYGAWQVEDVDDDGIAVDLDGWGEDPRGQVVRDALRTRFGVPVDAEVA